MEKIKNKNDILKEMQVIAEEVAKKKEEIEILLKILDELQVKYYNLADQIKVN